MDHDEYMGFVRVYIPQMEAMTRTNAYIVAEGTTYEDCCRIGIVFE